MARSVADRYLRKPYARVIIPDDEGRYAAQVLEFPGCYSEGESPEEAYQNLEEAARNWVESALAQGFPVPPPFATQGYSGTISLRLPKSLHRRAVEFAHRDGVSLNQFLVTAIATRVGAENFYETVASKLDDRLDALQASQLFMVASLGLAAPVANVVSGPPPEWLSAAFSRIETASPTPPYPQTRGLLRLKED